MWKEKRKNILLRDNQECKICNSPASIWIPNSGEPGGTHIVIIENSPMSKFPKEVKREVRYLQIHHKFYVIENKILVNPWEYDDDALITLCHICHGEKHSNNKSVPIFEKVDGILLNIDDYYLCSKCGGEGYLPEYSHVQNGICFKCMGKRIFRKARIIL